MQTQNRAAFLQSPSDYDILAPTYCQMDAALNQHMRELLLGSQAGSITNAERDELDHLIGIYEHGSLLKAQAAAEAIRRGLIERLTL